MRTLFFIFGVISVGLGVLGIFLPILPTTPFLLLAAAAFLRSSEKMHDWLLNHPHLGGFIEPYQSGKGIPAKAQIYSILLLWLTLGFSLVFVVKLILVRLILFHIGLGVTIYLLSLKTSDR